MIALVELLAGADFFLWMGIFLLSFPVAALVVTSLTAMCFVAKTLYIILRRGLR